MNIVKSWYCVLWAGHVGVITHAFGQPYDDVICRRCHAVQGDAGWWNVGTLHPKRWRVPS